MAQKQLMDSDISWAFRRGSWIYPHPVAVACGGIIRSRSPEILLDGVLKGAEVLARYLAAVAVASYAAREDDPDKAPFGANRLSGSLAFGDFLGVVQQLTKVGVDHPLKGYLASGFAAKGKGKTAERGVSDLSLITLLELRNRLGHDLAGVSRARATNILKEECPHKLLRDALAGVDRLLSLPLFVVEEQRIDEGKIIARRLLLMGESADPQPEDVVFGVPLQTDHESYLGLKQGALLLPPMLIWRIARVTANYRLFVVDVVSEDSVKYKAVETEPIVEGAEMAADIRGRLAGSKRALEPLSLADGRSVAQEWLERQDSLVKAREQIDGRVPWDTFDAEVLKWFADRLDPQDTEEDAVTIVRAGLLDGRDQLSAAEVDQLVLLFGTEVDVKRRLHRELIDLRAIITPDVRWDERVESHANVLTCLKLAVEFFVRHVGLSGVTSYELAATSGTADYVAMREALVNMFIHQDYSDASAAAQIEIRPEHTMVFNPGRSLVSNKALVEGGRSQARNPLIARALRLVGFAELAGSGLRQLHRVWRKANRRPPMVESDRSANTFTLTLDWLEITDAFDKYWKEKIGVTLSESEACILNLALDSEGLVVEQVASATGQRIDDAQAALESLARQALLNKRGNRYFIAEHLEKLVK